MLVCVFACLLLFSSESVWSLDLGADGTTEGTMPLKPFVSGLSGKQLAILRYFANITFLRNPSDPDYWEGGASCGKVLFLMRCS